MSNSTPPDLLSQPTAPQEPQPLLTGGVYQGFENDLRAFRRNKADAEQELWAATMRTAIKTDPALYAEADRLALDQGVTVDWALRNIDNVRRMARVKQMRDDRIEATNPSWFRSMQSLEFARKAWDDDHLPILERWSRAYESGQLITERGRIAARSMFTSGAMSQEDVASLERIQKRQGEIGPVSGFFPNAVEMIGQQSKSLPEALAAGAAGGGAAALATSFTGPGAGAAFVGGFKAAFWSTLAVNAFEVEAGNAYVDMIQAGYDPDRSWNAAFGIGLVNAALEMGGTSLATGGLRREVGRLLTRKALEESAKGAVSGFALGFAKEYLKGVGGEAATEMMQELVNIAGEEAARRPGDASLSPEGIASRLWEVASKTTQGMAILGLPNAYAGGNRARVAAMVQKAKQDAEQRREAIKAGAQSPLTKNDPAAAEQFMEQTLAENGTPRTVFVDAAMLRDVLAQADKAATEAGDGLTKSAGDILESIVPGITEQIEDQAAQGGDVQVPTAKLITTIAQQLPQVAEALNEHGRMDPALPSAAVAAEMQKEVEAQAKQADTGTDAEKAFRESLAKVEEQVAKGFTETATSLRPAELRSVTRIAAEMVARIAEGENITPEQAWQRYGAAITNQPLTEEALQQPSTKTDTPEFKAWFGESKVVDFNKMGEKVPLVVYHSTDAKFTEFQVGELGFHFGTKQQAETIGGANTIRAWLSIKNPIRLRDVGTWSREAPIAAELRRVSSRYGWTEDEIFSVEAKVAALRSERRSDLDSEDGYVVAKAQFDVSKPVRDFLESKGFDGVVYKNEAEGRGDSYIAFKPTQIKSTRNRGTFDQNNPNILRQQAKPTESASFREWFGKSKVVDADGKPRVVYHGTKSPTEDMAFDFSKIGSNGRSEGAGFYFTTDQKIASGYAEGRLLETWLAIKKPMPLKQKGWTAPTLRKILKRAAELEAEANGSDIRDGFLSNFADTYGQGVSAAISEAARLVGADERAVDQMGGLVGAGLSPEHVNRAVVEVTGFDGIVSNGFGDEGGNGGTIYVAFLPEQIKSVNNRGTFSPTDPNILRQPARGGFIRRALAVLFGEKSDASTVLHELTHWYTEIVDRLAQQGSPWAVQQMNVLLDRWKLTREQWDAMPDAERAKHYEDISYNAEEYFATGQAPSKELAGVFEKLRKFILRVYSNVIKSFGSLRGGLEASYREQFGRDLPAMTPELRGFFDRMLASEQAIEIAQAEREGAVAFDKAAAKSLGLDDATVAEVERLQTEAKDEAKAKLSAEAVRGARYFQAARRGAEKDAKAKLRAAEERVRKEVEEEFRDNPAQNAYRYLRDGIYENADGELVKDKSARKLSSVSVRRILGLPAIKGGEKGTSLVGRIRQLGGIRLDSYPGEIKGEFSIPGVFRKEGGQSWESVAQQLASEGYGGEVYDGDVAQSVDNMWLVDALTAAAQGERRYADEAVTESSRMQTEYQNWLRTQSADADQAVREAKANAAEREAMFTKLARRGLVQKSEAQQIRDAYAEARRKVSGRKLSAEEMRQVRESTKIVEGSDPDQIGALFGFQTGDEMLRALANMQLREEAIRRRVRQRIEAEEPLADPKKMRQAVEAATHGKAAARLASTLLRAMLNNTRSTAELEAAAQQAAKAVLARTPVGQISVRGFSQAELRAGKAAREALKSGKVDEAIEAQRKHLLQHYLTRFAVDIEKELDKFNDTVGGSYMKPDADILKAKRDLDRVQAIRSILGKYEAIGSARAEAADAYLGTMANQNPTGHAELAARIGAATAGAKPWRLVPLDRWRQVMEETAQLWHESKRSEQVRIAGVMRQRQEVQEELEAQIVEVFGDPSGKTPKPTTTDWDPATWLASIKRLESLALALDGGKVGGPWQRYVYRTLKDAQTERDAEMLVEREWYRDHLEKHGDLAGPKYDGKRWLGDTFSTFESRAQIVGMLYQLGTDGNFRNMAIGNGWAWQKDGDLYAHDGRPFAPVFQDMLRDMVERGYLRREDFDLAQAAFDHIRDRLKTRLFDTSREVWGFYPKEVEAFPFDTPFGKYPGGYFPSKVDKANSNLGAKAQLDAVAEMRTDFVANHGNVPRGMTIARKDGAKQPRVMDVRLLWDHIADALQIIHLAGPTKDIAGLFRTGSLQESLRIADRNALPYVILPAIDRAARGKIVAPSDPGLLRFVNYVKQAASTMFLGLNPRNAAQQLTGLSNAALYSSIPEVWAAFWKFSRNPARAVAEVEQFSEAMRIRWSTEMQALAADIEQMFAPSTIGKVQNVATRWAFVMQRYTQMTTDAIAWSAAFEHHLPSVGEAEAVARADQAVRLSQGEKSPLDVPRALAGGAVAQLFTQFADYPNVVLNSVLSPPDGRRFAAIMLALVTPTLASSLIALAFAGGRLGKGARTDDDTPEEIVAKLIGDQIKGAFSMIPAVGGTVGASVVALVDTVAEAAFGKATPKLGGETQLRNSPFAAQALVETVQRLASGSASPRDVAAFASMLTKLPLMPFGNAFNYMERVDEGKSRPANALDYGRGLIMGR